MRGRRTTKAAAHTGLRPQLEELFEAEYDPMYRLAFVMLGSNRDAEEIVQDAFAAVTSGWASIENPGGYLRVSVVNGARKRMRTRIRRGRAEDSLSAVAGGVSSPPAEYLLDVVDGLPDRQRLAVVLTYYAGLNSVEVGELVDCPSATVRSLVHRALTQLRRELSP